MNLAAHVQPGSAQDLASKPFLARIRAVVGHAVSLVTNTHSPSCLLGLMLPHVAGEVITVIDSSCVSILKKLPK